MRVREEDHAPKVRREEILVWVKSLMCTAVVHSTQIVIKTFEFIRTLEEADASVGITSTDMSAGMKSSRAAPNDA